MHSAREFHLGNSLFPTGAGPGQPGDRGAGTHLGAEGVSLAAPRSWRWRWRSGGARGLCTWDAAGRARQAPGCGPRDAPASSRHFPASFVWVRSSSAESAGHVRTRPPGHPDLTPGLGAAGPLRSAHPSGGFCPLPAGSVQGVALKDNAFQSSVERTPPRENLLNCLSGVLPTTSIPGHSFFFFFSSVTRFPKELWAQK